MNKSVYLSGYGVWWGVVHKQLLSGNPIFPVRSLHILVLCDMPWSLYKRPLCSEYSGIHLIGPWWWRQGQSPAWIPYWCDLLWWLHYIITFSCREILRSYVYTHQIKTFWDGIWGVHWTGLTTRWHPVVGSFGHYWIFGFHSAQSFDWAGTGNKDRWRQPCLECFMCLGHCHMLPHWNW